MGIRNSTLKSTYQPIKSQWVPSLVSCGNSLRLVDDSLFVLERQHPPTAIGAIDNKIVVTTHDAREKKPLNALRFEFAGQFHGSG